MGVKQCSKCKISFAFDMFPKRKLKKHRSKCKKCHRRELERKHNNKNIDSLSDSYVKTLLVQNSNIKRAAVPKELIELKRVQLQIKRKLKEIKSCNQPQSPT